MPDADDWDSCEPPPHPVYGWIAFAAMGCSAIVSGAVIGWVLWCVWELIRVLWR
jgi:hypothetical protein